MDLRRRSKHGVVEAMKDISRPAIGQELPRPYRDTGVDRMNSVAEARNELIEPIVQGVRAVRIESRSLFDNGFDLHKRNCRKKRGYPPGFRSSFEGWTLFPPGAKLLNRAVSINKVFKRVFLQVGRRARSPSLGRMEGPAGIA